jgi:hypothetical protein
VEAILNKHGSVLRHTGLVTGEPVRLFRAQDLSREGAAPPPYFVETFQWRDDEAADLVHQTPEVMAVWETIGPHVDQMTLTTLEAVA